MTINKQYKPLEDYDDYHVDRGTTHSLIAMYLIDNGMADTRANVIAEDINMCFKAVCPLDTNNLALCKKLLPELFTLAKFYNDVYGDGTYNFHELTETIKEIKHNN